MDGTAQADAGRGCIFAAACDLLDTALAGSLRNTIVDEVSAGRTLSEALRILRRSMLEHTFRGAAGSLCLEGIVREWDERTRAEGFHVLQEWDGRRFMDDPIPVLMLDFVARTAGERDADRRACAILLDYYLLYVLALFVMRSWDGDDPGRDLDRVTALLGLLQGPQGSGLALVDDAETLLWIAISHYEPDDAAYGRLLGKAKTLDPVHRLRLARVGAAVLGGHLRWGLPAYYRSDYARMREDNVSDYPWLFFAVDALLREYERMKASGERGRDRERVVETLLAGLSADPRALLDPAPPASLAGSAVEIRGFRQRFARLRAALVAEMESLRPADTAWSPVGFNFNFPHNVIIPMVTLALTDGIDERRNASFNALIERDSRTGRSAEVLARTLADYAARNPERRGERAIPMITWDPGTARLDFERTLAQLIEPEAAPPSSRPDSR